MKELSAFSDALLVILWDSMQGNGGFDANLLLLRGLV